MNNTLKIDKVLIYNDGPELFTANDTVGTKYLSMRIDHESDDFMCMSIAISEAQLLRFLKKQITLRRLFEFPENGMWFMVTAESKRLVFSQIHDPSIIADYLPDPTFVFMEPYIERTVRIPSIIDFFTHATNDIQCQLWWPDDIHAHTSQPHMRRRANETVMFEHAFA